MFENKRIDILEKRCRKLQEDNQELNKRCAELQGELMTLHRVVDAANNYTDEHRKAMVLLNESRDRYELAYKQMKKLQKEYELRMNKVLKDFE